jgi:hypothetical protein
VKLYVRRGDAQREGLARFDDRHGGAQREGLAR